MIQNTLNELMAYAKIHLGMESDDAVFYKNIVADMMNVVELDSNEVDEDRIDKMLVPDEILAEITVYLLENEIVEDILVPNFLAKIMGIITPTPSAVTRKFKELYSVDKSSATDYLYDLSIKNNYIQKTAVDKNLWWQADYENGASLEITVNLSKPEKSNAEIAKLLTQKSTNYPKCMLCSENVGFAGNLSKPARQHLRTIDLTVDGAEWFMQFSPYVYYDEHCIVVNKDHTLMSITESTFEKLVDFVETFPNYFVGSNACLPIVGGSILNHEHYQGGLHLMPLHKCGSKRIFTDSQFKNVKVSILDWYNSCIRIMGKDRTEVTAVAKRVLNTFNTYSDEAVGIFSETNGTLHNAITPLARILDGEYCIEIILRNNITNEEHPDGVFHAHKEYHDVKSEGIGLIEAMGLFILPPRVLKSMEENNGVYTKEYVNSACQNILKNTAIFKEDKLGQEAFGRFMNSCGFMEV